ncbi:MAG: endo-1,4-beta-xylanase [Lachnospiraceae bacterium]|nr:endo-1,4-beta-xylanase [Lachnospiraceae bacterium]
MKYILKNQKTAADAYVILDTKRNPQRVYGKINGDNYEFECDLPRAYFATKLLIEGFGSAIIFADNLEEGYLPSDEPLDFLREGTKSHLNRVEKFGERIKNDWGFLPKQPADRIALSHELLSTGREEDVEKALAEACWAGEELVLFDSDNKIAKRGRRNTFTFGCCMKGFTDGGDVFKDHFKHLFKQATIPFHWGIWEPYRGETHYELMDDMLDWLRENNIPVRGHALVWFSCWWEHENWQGELEFPEIKKLLVERAEMIFKKHPNVFECIDFNEPLMTNPFNFTFDEYFEIVKAVYDVLKKYSPETRVMINLTDEWQLNYGIDVNNIPSQVAWRRRYKLPDYVENDYCATVPMFIDRCIAEGMKIDLIGLQFNVQPYDLFGSYELLNWWHDRYGLPIHITETSTPSEMGKAKIRYGLRPAPASEMIWHHPWTQSVQAEWYREFGRLFYATDYVEVFNVWSLSDAPTQWADYLEGHINEKFKLNAWAYDGIMDYDDKPKEVYHAIEQMIENWQLDSWEPIK